MSAVVWILLAVAVVEFVGGLLVGSSYASKREARELRDALRRIVAIGEGPFDREMRPDDRWLPALNTVTEIAKEALEDA